MVSAIGTTVFVPMSARSIAPFVISSRSAPVPVKAPMRSAFWSWSRLASFALFEESPSCPPFHRTTEATAPAVVAMLKPPLTIFPPCTVDVTSLMFVRSRTPPFAP